MKKWDHAIVIGGSIAGLFAAKVLSEHFNKVTIIERDVLPDVYNPRGGVPQDRHVHQILVGGLNVMRELFPTIDEELRSIDAQPIEMGYNLIVGTRQGVVEPVRTGMHTFACSRPRLEYVIRQQIKNLDNVTFEMGYTANKLIADEHNRTILGVEVSQKKTKYTKEHYGDLRACFV